MDAKTGGNISYIIWVGKIKGRSVVVNVVKYTLAQQCDHKLY